MFFIYISASLQAKLKKRSITISSHRLFSYRYFALKLQMVGTVESYFEILHPISRTFVYPVREIPPIRSEVLGSQTLSQRESFFK